MAVRKRSGDAEGVLGRNERLAFKEATQGVDLGRGPVGDVGDGAFANFGALADGLAEQDGRGRIAIGDALHIHGFIIALATQYCKDIINYYMGT